MSSDQGAIEDSELVAGPYFEDFEVGDQFNEVPGITITEGYTALHQAVFGDRLRLPLDHELCRQVTGQDKALINPSLVTNLAIGQSTLPSQRVMGNLFYRGLYFRQPVFVGDTLNTRTKVIALKQNRVREGRAASGMVALEINVVNQRQEDVLLFWRCPMIPCKDPNAVTGKDDDFSSMPDSLDNIEKWFPDWDLDSFRERTQGVHGDQLVPGQQYLVDSRETVTMAPEMVRLTLNMAMTHTDASRSVYGKRLVYGGHTISVAAAQLVRAFPNLVTIAGWYQCDHTGPVFEGDILQSSVIVENKRRIRSGYLVDFQIKVQSTQCQESPEPGRESEVLDWRLSGLFA